MSLAAKIEVSKQSYIGAIILQDLKNKDPEELCISAFYPMTAQTNLLKISK